MSAFSRQRQHATPGSTGAPLLSAPALAAALRHTDRRTSAKPIGELLKKDPLVPMYRIRNGRAADEIQTSVHILNEISERMRRLNDAYAEWEQFDAGAYFDLTELQAERLVKVSERVTTVHVTFFVDQLLPSFRQAEVFWNKIFQPDYRRLTANLVTTPEMVAQAFEFYADSQTQMIEHWDHLVDIVEAIRAEMREDIAFWATNSIDDERARYRHAWRRPPAPGLKTALLPELETVPTLTLSVDFPLPAFRQPGRVRRLRRSRDRRRRR